MQLQRLFLQGCSQDERSPQTSTQQLTEAAANQVMSLWPHGPEVLQDHKGHSKAVKPIKSKQAKTYVAEIRGDLAVCISGVFVH